MNKIMYCFRCPIESGQTWLNVVHFSSKGGLAAHKVLAVDIRPVRFYTVREIILVLTIENSVRTGRCPVGTGRSSQCRKKLHTRHTRSNEKVVERSTTPNVIAAPRAPATSPSRFTHLLFQQKRSGLLLFAIETDKAEPLIQRRVVGGRALYTRGNVMTFVYIYICNFIGASRQV